MVWKSHAVSPSKGFKQSGWCLDSPRVSLFVANRSKGFQLSAILLALKVEFCQRPYESVYSVR